MEEYHRHKDEDHIVIKVTPRNLERIIYLLVILGLLVYLIVSSPECPKVECNQPEPNATAPSTIQAAPEPPRSEVKAVPNTSEEEPSPKLSGTVEFTLVQVTTCIVNDTLKRGQIEDIEVEIKNGLNRKLEAKLDIFLWGANDPAELKNYAIRHINDVGVLSGATMKRTFEVNGGMFVDSDKDKNIKVALMDTETEKQLDAQTKIVKTTRNC